MAHQPTQKGRQARVFISYKRQADPDEEVALFLAKALQSAGCSTFIDQSIQLGSDWGDAIDRNIDESDIFIFLLSDNSIQSIEVRNELRRARAFTSKTRELVPIKIALQGNLPFEIRSIVDSVQYFQWNSDHDSQRLINHLVTLINTAGFAVHSVEVDSEISSTKSSRFDAAREGVLPFLSKGRAEISPTDDTLFLVHETEFLLEMLFIVMEQVITGGFIPPPELDREFVFFKTMVTSAIAYASRPGKDKRLAENLRLINQTFDDVVSRVFPRLREIPREARYSTWDEDDRVNEQKAQEYRARGGLETSDLVPELAKGMSDALTRSIKNKRRLEDALQRERMALQLVLEECYASISGRVALIAQDRRWKAGTWGFDIDPDTRRKLRISCNKSQAHELFRTWKTSWFRRQTDPFPFILYFTFCSDPTEDSTLEEYLQMAVQGTLMVPASPAHDEWRSALYDKASVFALRKLMMSLEESESYLTADVDYAKAVNRCFDIRTQHFFPEEESDLKRRKIILLACAKEFDQAFDSLVSEGSNWREDEGMYLHAAKIASLAGKYDHALRWLRERVSSMPPLNFHRLNNEQDLQGLRKANPHGLAEMLRLGYKLEWRNCLFLADLLLTNTAMFPVSNVTVKCIMGGQEYVKHCDLVGPRKSYKWTNVSLNVGNRNTSFMLTDFVVESEQGTFRGLSPKS